MKGLVEKNMNVVVRYETMAEARGSVVDNVCLWSYDIDVLIFIPSRNPFFEQLTIGEIVWGGLHEKFN